MKFSTFNYAYEHDNGILLYNTGNQKFVKITTPEDVKHFNELRNSQTLDIEDKMVAQLYKHGYIIDDDYDEYNVFKNKIYSEYLEKQNDHFFLLLHVTNQCNFRCVYCPQEHVTERFSKKRWNALYKHIKNNIENGTYKEIYISFFGGEPLLEVKNIIEFLKRLQKLKKKFPEIKFEHYITTNGYLLTPDIYKQLTSLGIKRYTITVDGFAETHNKMRMLANGKGTWDKIIENLKFINTQKDDTHITVRTNTNASNSDSLIDFQNWILANFDNNKFLPKMYHIAPFSERVNTDLLEQKENIEEIYRQSTNISSTVTKNENNPLQWGDCLCKYAWKHNFSMSTKGKLAKCDNISESYDGLYIGEMLDNGDFKFYVDMNIFDNYEIEECKICTYYPLCLGRRCPQKKYLGNGKSRPDCHFYNKKSSKELLDYIAQKLLYDETAAKRSKQ